MGRKKLEIKYREDFRSRRSTYMTRMKGVRKKSNELSLLCGVDVLLASFSPELNTLEFWPKKDTPEFNRIRDRYLSIRNKNLSGLDNSGDEGNGKSKQQTPSPSFSMASFTPEEEMAAMQTKLDEVRDRLRFLRGHQCQEEEEWFHAQFMPLQQDFHLHQSSSPFLQSLPPTLQMDFTQSLPPPLDPLHLPSSLSQSHTTCLADSPLGSQSDDFTWCDSLLLDHEYGS